MASLDERKVDIMSYISGLQSYFIKDALTGAPENISDAEKIVDAIGKIHNLTDHSTNIEDMCYFVNQILSLNSIYLTGLGATEINFYDNLNLQEALLIIFTRMFKESDTIHSKNKFPEKFDFMKGFEGRVTMVVDTLMGGGKKWLPIINSGSLIPGKITNKVIETLSLDEITDCKILFHGTSWNNAIRIMHGVKSTTRGSCSDFGMYNFYTVNNLMNAFEWSLLSNGPGSSALQSAVNIFVVPNDIFYSLNIKDLSDTNEWKNVVYYLRNQPEPFETDNYSEDLKTYEDYVSEMDLFDVVLGPIMSNPKAKLPSDVTFKRNNDGNIPIQVSFKPSIVDILNTYLHVTVFLSERN